MTEDVFYHGTRRGFSKGGYLFPRSWHQGAGTSAPVSAGRRSPSGSEGWVYVTRSRTLAWVYAWHAPGRGKPKVLVVQPQDDLEPDPEHSVEMDAWRCRMARVLDVLVEPEISEQEAREGWVH